MAKREKKPEGIVEFTKTIIYAGLIAVGIHTFLFQPFYIPSGSMVPSLRVDDFVIVNKFAYGYSRYSFPSAPNLFSGRIFGSMPKRGAVVVFRPPGANDDFIKRVIGLPGDTIQMKQGELYINGTLVPRTYVGQYIDTSSPNLGPVVTKDYNEHLPGGVTHPIIKVTNGPEFFGGLDPNNTPVYVVPPGHLFMMGDNRDNSEDSRFLDGPVGYVPVENIIGPAEIIFFSIHMDHPFWEFWEWPFEIRWDRLFHSVP